MPISITIDWQKGDYYGIGEDIGLRVTRARTFDNESITVPNSQLTDNAVKTPVAKDKLRQKFVFDISYDDDIGTERKMLMTATTMLALKTAY